MTQSLPKRLPAVFSILNTTFALESNMIMLLSERMGNAARGPASTLEILPAEIRRHLLLTLEYEALQALVYASPIYHQQYLLDRKHHLCACLETTLGRSTIHDACAVYHSSVNNMDSRIDIEVTRQFLGSYQEQRTSASTRYPSLFWKSLSLEQVISMVAFYVSVIKPLIGPVAGQTLKNLAKDIKKPPIHGPLSKTEEARIVRALYRFQLYCNIFGVGNIPKHSGRDSPRRAGFHKDDFFEIFMLYEPWEFEKFFSICNFSKMVFDKVFDDLYDDLNNDPADPRFGKDYALYKSTFDMDDIGLRSVYLDGIVSHGVELLRHVIFKIKDHEHLLETVPQHVECPMGLGFHSFLYYMSRSLRSSDKRRQPSDQKERKPTTPFHGDSAEFPSLAWALVRKKEDECRWLCGIVRDHFRDWGYVMWEAARLEQTGAKQFMLTRL